MLSDSVSSLASTAVSSLVSFIASKAYNNLACICFNEPKRFDIGLDNAPSNCAIISRRDGSFEIAVISSTPTTFPSTMPPFITREGMSLAVLTKTFAAAAGSLSQTAIAVGPANRSLNCSTSVSFAAIFRSVFLTILNSVSASFRLDLRPSSSATVSPLYSTRTTEGLALKISLNRLTISFFAALLNITHSLNVSMF